MLAAVILLGKGLWLHQLSQAGSPEAVVKHTLRVGLTHLYLRLGWPPCSWRSACPAPHRSTSRR